MTSYAEFFEARKHIMLERLQQMQNNDELAHPEELSGLSGDSTAIVVGFTMLVNLAGGDGETYYCFITAPEDIIRNSLGDVAYMDEFLRDELRKHMSDGDD